MGQQWPAMGMETLVNTGLGSMALVISSHGGGCHQPHQRVTEQATHKLENNYAKEVLALLQKF